MTDTISASAWANCCTNSTPSEHTGEITAPLARDNVNGINRYKTEYESLYPSAHPTKK